MLQLSRLTICHIYTQFHPLLFGVVHPEVRNHCGFNPEVEEKNNCGLHPEITVCTETMESHLQQVFSSPWLHFQTPCCHCLVKIRNRLRGGHDIIWKINQIWLKCNEFILSFAYYNNKSYININIQSIFKE